MRNRRTFITGVATASTVAISGCLETDLEGIAGNVSVEDETETGDVSTENETQTDQEENQEEEEEESTESGPEEAVREYFSAIIRGDVEAANSYIHPDGEINKIDEEVQSQNDIQIEVSQTEVIEQSEQAANVEFELVATGEDETERSSETAHLRVHDDQWKLYDSGERDIGEESNNEEESGIEKAQIGKIVGYEANNKFTTTEIENLPDISNNTITHINVSIMLASDSAPVDLREASYTIETPSSATFVNGDANSQDGLTLSQIQGVEENETVLSDQDDIMVAEFNLSEINGTKPVGENTRVTLILNSPSGEQSTIEVRTPRNIQENESYIL